MEEVTVSSKNQIVVPRKAREALRISAGTRLQVVVRGDTVIIMRKPKSYAERLAGIAKGLYPADYLDEERDSW
jgi:AbrB family looped-hinge helix DNA binding protein